jgi:hypothetical protein
LEILQRLVERIGHGGHGRKREFTDFGGAVKSTCSVKENK